MSIRTKVDNLSGQVRDAAKFLRELGSELESMRAFLYTEEAENMVLLHKKDSEQKEAIENLSESLAACNERNQSQAQALGEIRKITHGEGKKNLCSHIEEIMTEFERLAPDHPLLKSEEGE